MESEDLASDGVHLNASGSDRCLSRLTDILYEFWGYLRPPLDVKKNKASQNKGIRLFLPELFSFHF
ncbi:MAG: hypothetical protein ACK5JN_00175 [Kluyvera sp.]|uniref:hypothetical protein n=1 Tax=Kluyvera sp. TaxID=1538228 RepID=UPI003A841CA4